MMDQKHVLLPPDGGWGWMVVLGASLVNLSTRSIEPSFGILFGDLLKELNVATTGASVVMSTLDAMVNFSGLFVGPLIKRYSYRKVCIFGGLLSFLALTSTAAADSLIYLISTYSILGGLGFGLVTACTFVAVNSYFLERRGQAVGLAMAGTALGFMAMPQIVSFLLMTYDFRGAVLILGAISLNTLVGGMLLQPVLWHMKQPPSLTTVKSKQNLDKLTLPELQEPEKDRLLSVPSAPCLQTDDGLHRVSSNLGVQRQLSFVKQHGVSQKISLISIPHIGSMASLSQKKRKTSVISNVSHLDFMGSTMHIALDEFEENDDDKGVEMKSNLGEKEKTLSAGCSSFCRKLHKVMDLHLLKDPIYLNIIFGLSMTYVAELNFKTIVPFFMENLNFTKQDTASALSFMAIADILARVAIPPILDRLPYSRRSTLMFGCFFLCICRSLLAEQTTWTGLLACFITNGFLRGVTLINFPLVLSEYATNDKYPAALGLSMVAKGIFIVILGPLVGYIRDVTTSYSLCIHTQTFMIASCFFAWGIEYIIVWRRQKTKPTVDF